MKSFVEANQRESMLDSQSRRYMSALRRVAALAAHLVKHVIYNLTMFVLRAE